MANEITFTASLSINKTSIMSAAIARSVTNLLRNMTGTTYIQDTMLVTTAEIAIPLGGVTSPHWAFFNNLDATNYIQIYDATGQSAHAFIRLLAGDCAFVPMDTSLTAPFAKANTASCQMEFLIVSA